MSTDGVQIEISAQDEGASAEFSDVLARIQDIEKELNKMSAAGKDAGDKIKGAAHGAGQGLSEAHGHTLDFSKGLQELADHGLMAARGLDVLGLDANVAAVKVAGLADVIGKAGDAVPALVAAGIAIAGIGVAYSFLHDAVESAGDLDQHMAILGQTVKNQGGDWGVLGEEVRKFAEDQASKTIFGVDEIVQALTRLTASGMSVADSMTTVRVAEDAAAATGRSLSEVTQDLLMASEGNARALTTLGLATKEQIKDGMTYNEVLQLVERNMGGAAQVAATTLPGALAGLSTAFKTLEEDAGESLQSVVVEGVDDLTGFVHYIQGDVVGAVGDFASFVRQHMPEIVEFFHQLWNTAETGGEVFRDDFLPILQEVWQAITDLVGDGEDLAQTLDKVNGQVDDGESGWEKLRDVLHEVGQDAQQLKAFFDGIADSLNRVTSEQNQFADTMSHFWNDSPVGKVLTAVIPGLGGLTQPLPGEAANQSNAGAAAEDGRRVYAHPGSSSAPSSTSEKHPPGFTPHTGVNTEIGGSHGSKAPSWIPPEIPGGSGGSSGSRGPDSIVSGQKELNEAIKAITESETSYKNAVELATTADAKYAAQTALNAKEESDRKKIINDLTYAINEEKKQGTELAEQLRADQSEHLAAVKALKEYEAELGTAGPKTAEQKDRLREYQDAVKAANTALTDVNKKIVENTANLTTNTAALQKNTDAINPNAKAHAQAALAFNDAIASQQQSLKDMLGTYGQSEAAQRAYWQEQYAIAVAGGDQMEKRAAEVAAKLEQLDENDYKARVDLHTQFMNTIQSQEQTWIDNFVKGGMSLRDQLKQIWSDILGDFLKMLEQMIVKSQTLGSSGSGGLFSSILSAIFGSSTSGGGLAPGAAWAALDSVPGATPGSAAADIISTADGKATLTHITGFSPGAFFGTPAAPGAGAFIAAAAGGAFIGGAIGNLEGAGTGAQQTHAENGAIGGAIGASAALLLAGPAGWAAIAAMALGGAVLGGILGGAIGPHWGPATNYPDRSDTQHYGQFVSDINGWSGTFNGTTINPDKQYDTSAGGQSLASQLVAWENNTSATANLTDAQKATVEQLKALGNNISIANEKDGMFTLGDGTKISVTDYENLVSQVQNIRNGQAGTVGASPTFYASRTYPDFNLATVTDANGNVVINPWGNGANPKGPPMAPVGGGPGDPGAPGAPGSPTGPGNLPNPPTPRQDPRIEITIGTLVGSDGMNELKQILAAGLVELNSGQIPGGYAMTLPGRIKTKFS